MYVHFVMYYGKHPYVPCNLVFIYIVLQFVIVCMHDNMYVDQALKGKLICSYV